VAQEMKKIVKTLT